MEELKQNDQSAVSIKPRLAIPYNALEIIPQRLYFAQVDGKLSDDENYHYFNIDAILTYVPFYSDFGPLNLGHTYRFCQLINTKLNSKKLGGRAIIYYCARNPQAINNAVVLIGIYQVSDRMLSFTPTSLYFSFMYHGEQSFDQLSPFPPPDYLSLRCPCFNLLQLMFTYS